MIKLHRTTEWFDLHVAEIKAIEKKLSVMASQDSMLLDGSCSSGNRRPRMQIYFCDEKSGKKVSLQEVISADGLIPNEVDDHYLASYNAFLIFDSEELETYFRLKYL